MKEPSPAKLQAYLATAARSGGAEPAEAAGAGESAAVKVKPLAHEDGFAERHSARFWLANPEHVTSLLRLCILSTAVYVGRRCGGRQRCGGAQQPIGVVALQVLQPGQRLQCAAA